MGMAYIFTSGLFFHIILVNNYLSILLLTKSSSLSDRCDAVDGLWLIWKWFYYIKIKVMYNEFTNFCLQLIQPSAREVFTFWTQIKREEWGGQWGEERRIWHPMVLLETLKIEGICERIRQWPVTDSGGWPLVNESSRNQKPDSFSNRNRSRSLRKV